MGTSLEIAYSSRLEDRQLERDLILLGGGDSNGIFSRIEESGRLQFRFQHGPLTLRDLSEGVDYRASFIEMDLSQASDVPLEGVNIFERHGKPVAGLIVADYGILARMRNPYNPHRTLVLVAGLYGYGTWGGARLIGDREFLKQAAQLHAEEFECLYKVEVLQNMPVAVRPIILRPLR